MVRTNEHGQPIGDDLDGWAPPDFPPHRRLVGQYATLEPLTIDDHAEAILAAFDEAPESTWTYLPWGPLHDIDTVERLVTFLNDLPDWLSYAIVVDGAVVGFESYLRIDAPNGVIEIGGIAFSPVLQRTRAATDALRLLMAESFDLGYRRLEWKCDDLNGPSRIAAERLGFRYEGTFRKATHYRRRNRDTAWYSITDDEWPLVGAALDAWLDDDNFDEAGRQRRHLVDIRTQIGAS